MDTLLALPLGVRLALGALALVQLSLQLWSVMNLVRRPPSPGNQKLVWILVVVFGGLVGSLVFIGVGRKVLDDLEAAREGMRREESTLRGGQRERAIDTLYGDRDA